MTVKTILKNIFSKHNTRIMDKTNLIVKMQKEYAFEKSNTFFENLLERQVKEKFLGEIDFFGTTHYYLVETLAIRTGVQNNDKLQTEKSFQV